MNDIQPEYIAVGSRESHRKIAVRRHSGANPGLMWLGGYRSDMLGTKAEQLSDWSLKHQLAMCRHDYSGHGESGGEFVEGTISKWLEESLCVLEQMTSGPQILVGSSMGCWVALRMIEELQKEKQCDRIAGLLLLAPAPDFTHELMWPALSEAQRQSIQDKGFLEEPSEYSDEPNIYTRALFEDGARNLVMKDMLNTGCPVHIIQGMKDPDVPYEHALKLIEFLLEDRVTMTLVKDGDHRLSRDQDIALILRSVKDLVREAQGV